MSPRRRADRPARPMRGQPTRIVVLQLAIAAAAMLLALVTWTFTLASIGTEEREAQFHAEANVANLALAVEWQLQRQLQAIDETMQTLAADWRADPIHFDPGSWRRRSSLLGDLSLQVSLLDRHGFVVATTRQELMGVNQSERDYFQAQAASRRAGLFIGPAINWKATGRWEISLSRRLEGDDGAFAGAIVVTYDPWTLTSPLEQVDLGPRGLIALVGGDGAIRALVSPYEVRPGADIAGSAMFTQAVRTRVRTWTGPSAPDGVVRVHALRHLRSQDLTIVVGIDQDVALRAVRTWSVNARTFAFSVSFALLVMAWLLVREVRQAHAREERLAVNQTVLEAAYVELAGAKASAERKTAQIEATLAGMSDGLMLLDANLRLVQWNDRFPAYTGAPREVLRVGLPIEEVLRAQALAGEFGQVDVEAEVARRLHRLRAHTGVAVIERTRPNGRTLELRRAALPDGGVVTLYIDITAHKQAEEAHAQARRLAEEAIQQKSRFVAIVSHEIRTPLNAVVNSLALLDRSNLTPPQHALTETARQAGEALLDLVRDILDLTKAEGEAPALRPSIFEPREMLEGVRDMFAAQAAARNVGLVVEVAPDVPHALRADRGRLRQVVMNLVSNAAKFADPGCVTIRAATTRAAGGPALLIGVRDPGPRIPPAEAARLFQPFSRLDNATIGAVPGSGLGLAICERLARLMGGQIGLGPSPEGGNEFWLTLPLEVAVAPPRPPAEPVPLPPRVRPARVLLVEDLAANQLVAATILRREGHRVDIADSGAEALALARTRPYDLILMDLVMPGMSGYEATRRIRALPPPASAVPIVALTATTAPEDRARCLAVGMVEVLGKPVRPADLLAAVARVGGASPPAPPAPPDAPAAPAEAVVLDMARLADLRRGLSLAILAPLVEECLADIRQRLPLLREALRGDEPRRIDEAAHALAGMAGNFGLSGLEARMRRVMAAMRTSDIAAARAAVEGLDAEFSRSSEAIRLAMREAA